MTPSEVFEHSIQIQANATQVERCLTDLAVMHQWLNPALRCEPIGDWNTNIGGESRFSIQVPLIQPSLKSTVIEREPGLIVWQFRGFFEGCDRWECQPNAQGTLLLNRFEFTIPNPIVRWGFHAFAAPWTKQDMQSQLQRLKQVAERL